MPILDIQSRFRELGRIRMGRKVPTRNGKMRPEKLARFRLTSQWAHLIEQAAAVFGGECSPWDNDGSSEFEVLVEVDAIPIVIPPGEIMEQWYELWSGGGCQRRCDGINQVLVAKPCACPKDPLERQDLAGAGKACKPTTRLKVMIPDVSDVGIWRLESHGFHAAAELGGSAGLVEAATRRGAMIPADLRLQAREGARRPGEPTKKFYVPAISFRGALGPTLDALGMLEEGATMPRILGVDPGKPALDAGGREALPPSGTAFDPRPTEDPSFPGESPAIEAPRRRSRPDPTPEAEPSTPEAYAPENATQAPRPPEDLPPVDNTPPPPSHPEGRSYSGPQIIAMRFDERGVKSREEKLRILSQLHGRPITSAKDLETGEIQLALHVLNDDEAFAELLAEVGEQTETPAAPTAGDGEPEAESSTAPAPRSEHVPADAVSVVPPPRITPGAAAPDPGPRGWTGDQWTAFIREHKVTAVAVLQEARSRAAEVGSTPPSSLAEIPGSGLEEVLAGFVTDQTGRN